MRKTLIIGDVHGCLKEFLALLKKANYTAKSHRVILVGDIINRGPYSLEMLEWTRKKGVELVCGNHEQAFINGVRNNSYLSPVFKTLKKNMKKDLNKWMKWLEALSFYIEEEDFLVVHAGLVPGEHPEYSDPQAF